MIGNDVMIIYLFGKNNYLQRQQDRVGLRIKELKRNFVFLFSFCI